MKVILLQDVAKIGQKYQIVQVPDGYAFNKLIPQNLAKPATPQNVKQIEKRAATLAEQKESGDQFFAAAIEKMTAEPLKIEVEPNGQGHLFQAVHAEDVIKAASAVGVEITANQIVFASPIKEVGSHTITLSNGEKKSEITIEVVSKK